jgi:hypothetical protein
MFISLNRIYHDYTVVYLEYQNVCFIFGIWSPHPLPRKRVCLLPWIQRAGGATLSCGRGGTQFGRLDRKPGTEFSVESTKKNAIECETRQHFVGTPCIIYDFSFLRIQLGLGRYSYFLAVRVWASPTPLSPPPCHSLLIP